MSADAPGRRPLVLGIGNVLMGDEGVGVHAVRRLEATDLAAKADFLDGGTGGFHLLGSFDGRERIILIDAATDGRPPGTVTLLRPRFASDFPRSLSAHDIGLRDLVESASLLGSLPRIDLVTVSVAELQPMTIELSPAVAGALDKVDMAVRDLTETF
jgi:hydrogenase maturation protease